MQLAEINRICPVTIRRDGEFRSLGTLSQDADQMLVMLYDPDYLKRLLGNPNIACVVTRPDLAAEIPDCLGMAVCDDPAAAFYRVHDHLAAETDFYWRPFDSEISPEAAIHPTAHVAPRNVRIGRGTVVGPNAVVLERSILGEDVVVGPGAVIGGEGFEPKFVAGRHVIVRHAGGCRLGDRVEIQANSHVARAVFNGFTEVGEDTKIDALVHIAHNARIGRRCELASGAHVAGSATVGDDVWIGPHATISSEVRVADGAFVAIGSVVVRRVTDRQRVFGVPAAALP